MLARSLPEAGSPCQAVAERCQRDVLTARSCIGLPGSDERLISGMELVTKLPLIGSGGEHLTRTSVVASI